MTRRKLEQALLALPIMVLAFGFVPFTVYRAAAAPRCFPEAAPAITNCIDDRFRDYWERNGGLAVFGYPITAAQPMRNRDTGATYLTQYFERQRMEYHPENQAPYTVLLGRLGDDQLRASGRDWRSLPPAAPDAPHRSAATGHAIGAAFWSYWRSRGLEFGDPGISERESLALFGHPLTEPAVETNSSGDTVLTQYFERARLELHADGGRQIVLQGLLGNEARGRGDGSPSPSASPSGAPSASPSGAPSGTPSASPSGAPSAPAAPSASGSPSASPEPSDDHDDDDASPSASPEPSDDNGDDDDASPSASPEASDDHGGNRGRGGDDD